MLWLTALDIRELIQKHAVNMKWEGSVLSKRYAPFFKIKSLIFSINSFSGGEQFCPSVNFSDNQVKFKGICEETDGESIMIKIVHVHGKDAVVDREHIRKYSAWFGESYCVHRFPGSGECDWGEIIHILSEYGYKSDICIEGFHDPVYSGEREYEGQLAALSYLRKCRDHKQMCD